MKEDRVHLQEGKKKNNHKRKKARQILIMNAEGKKRNEEERRGKKRETDAFLDLDLDSVWIPVKRLVKFQILLAQDRTKR